MGSTADASCGTECTTGSPDDTGHGNCSGGGDGMESDRVSIKIVNEVPLIGNCAGCTKGSELLVSSTTAAALVLIGAAIQLPKPHAGP